MPENESFRRKIWKNKTRFENEIEKNYYEMREPVERDDNRAPTKSISLSRHSFRIF